MTCLNIMGTACCKFFCYCKAGVFTLIADGFHTVLCTLNIFFHNRSVFKRLFCRLCDGLFQLFLGINLCYGPASGTVCGLYNNRKALRKHSVSHRDCLKKRHRDSGLLKGSPHGKLVGGISIHALLFPGSPSFSARYCTVIFARSEPMVDTASGCILRQISRICSFSVILIS